MTFLRLVPPPSLAVSCHVCALTVVVHSRQEFADVEEAHLASCKAQVMPLNGSLADLLGLPLN